MATHIKVTRNKTYALMKMRRQLTECSRIQPGLREAFPVCLLLWVCSFEQNATQSQKGRWAGEPGRQGLHWGLTWHVNTFCYGSGDSFNLPGMKRGASWARNTTVPIIAPKPPNEICMAVWTDLLNNINTWITRASRSKVATPFAMRNYVIGSLNRGYRQNTS